jgi:hypothetical protein
MEEMSKIDEQAFSMKVMGFSMWTSRQQGAAGNLSQRNILNGP